METSSATSDKTKVHRYIGDAMLAKVFEGGVQCLSDLELICLVLRVERSAHAYERAGQWLVRFGSLRALLTADAACARTAGLNDRQYVSLQAALELARRHYQQLMMTGPALGNPRATREFARMRLRDLPHEVFAVLYLDNRNRVMGYEELFRGTIDGSSVHPREVVKHALARNAAAVILTHNHPSGVAEPSQADELITRRLKQALALVDIRVLDHLVVGDGVCESFAARGLL